MVTGVAIATSHGTNARRNMLQETSSATSSGPQPTDKPTQRIQKSRQNIPTQSHEKQETSIVTNQVLPQAIYMTRKIRY